MKKIMIIGGGKLGFAIVQGFLNAEIEKNDLLVVCRSNESRAKFSELGITTTNFIMGSHLKAYETIFLAVRPQDVGNAIVQIKGARSEFSRDTLPENSLISVVSGLSINVLSDYSGIHPRYITTATMNTNVAYNCGLITFTKFANNKTDSETVLKELGDVESVNRYQDILVDVTVKGSMNALDALALKWIYKKYYIDQSVTNFLNHVENQLRDDFFEQMDLPLRNYLFSKTKALKLFSERYAKIADTVAVKTLLSTVVFLDRSKITMKDHIKTVVTPGGCTERGINDVSNLEMEAIKSFLVVVHKRAMKFHLDVKRSFVEVKLEKQQKKKEEIQEAKRKIYEKGSFVTLPV